ncbi:hypothetical protein L1887_16030 [Cichorium endivia]|nr:hypothetical protein L1887_16030 [Cichorium endivia]
MAGRVIAGVANRRANRFVNRVRTEHRLRMEKPASTVSRHIPWIFSLSLLESPLGFKILAFFSFIFGNSPQLSSYSLYSIAIALGREKESVCGEFSELNEEIYFVGFNSTFVVAPGSVRSELTSACF